MQGQGPRHIPRRHECTPLDDYPGYYSVRDTLTGSGRFHIAMLLECDCADFTYRHQPCKHVEAVRATETALQTLCSHVGSCSVPIVPLVRW